MGDGRYRVTLARNGEAGIALSPSVVITDLFLPGRNGIALAQAKAQVIEGNCDRYLTKPISVNALKACIAELLQAGRG